MYILIMTKKHKEHTDKKKRNKTNFNPNSKGSTNHKKKHKWFIAIKKNDQNDQNLFDFSNFHIIPSPIGRFYADPFIIKKNNINYIFFEDFMYQKKKGVISYISIDENFNISKPKIVIERKYHLSYPFIFEYQQKIYIIPESYQSNNIELYSCEQFPDVWKLNRILIKNIKAVDTTLFEMKDKLWMLTSLKNNNDYDNNLSIFYANSLFQPWTTHPLTRNFDYNMRGAGKIFKYNNKLIRPSQDCNKRYGQAIVLSEIHRLDSKKYQDHKIHRIAPNWYPRLIGTHTINFNEDFIVFDGLLEYDNDEELQLLFNHNLANNSKEV